MRMKARKRNEWKTNTKPTTAMMMMMMRDELCTHLKCIRLYFSFTLLCAPILALALASTFLSPVSHATVNAHITQQIGSYTMQAFTYRLN